ncbi:hypothetical protein K435DRAFT_860576 [Dendrothele bispora CBS 962.96]|uniref:Uncharacterized protein n=1 Tax=Dendrothele bispora (strain CBS 962.96) TaxID=1314807 RepID=A0A4S8LXJ7_DENBC|nr:hypothetical protein K435DRAFT_860576 [Dendrothele bispora CBS 962.96]
MTPTNITQCSSSNNAFCAIDKAITLVNAMTNVSGVGHFDHLKEACGIMQSIGRYHLKSWKKTIKSKQIVEDEKDASRDEDVEVVEKVTVTKPLENQMHLGCIVTDNFSRTTPSANNIFKQPFTNASSIVFP